MQIEIIRNQDILFGLLQGELDHHSATAIRMELDEALSAFPVQKLVLDFSNITFMDSSGIGLLMGRYKLLQAQKAVLEVYGLSRHMYKVMHLAGLEQLIALHKSNLPKPYLDMLQKERNEEEKHETYA